MDSGGIIHFSEPIWRIIPSDSNAILPIAETRSQTNQSPTFFRLSLAEGAIELPIEGLSSSHHLIIQDQNGLYFSRFTQPTKPELAGLWFWSHSSHFWEEIDSVATEITEAEGSLYYFDKQGIQQKLQILDNEISSPNIQNSNILDSKNPLCLELISLIGATEPTQFYILELESQAIISFTVQKSWHILSLQENGLITLFETEISEPINPEITSISGILIALPNPKELLLLNYLNL